MKIPQNNGSCISSRGTRGLTGRVVGITGEASKITAFAEESPSRGTTSGVPVMAILLRGKARPFFMGAPPAVVYKSRRKTLHMQPGPLNQGMVGAVSRTFFNYFPTVVTRMIFPTVFLGGRFATPLSAYF